MAWPKLARLMLYSLKTSPSGVPGAFSASAANRWSTLTYSSFMRRDSFSASPSTLARRWVMEMRLGSMPPPETEGRLRSFSSTATARAAVCTPI